MTFRFRSLKTTQGAALLLALDGRSMDRMRLLKLLYIADRELLAESGGMLTGDRRRRDEERPRTQPRL